MRKLTKTLVAVFIVMVLAIVALIVTETQLRKIVPDQFASHTREFLNLTEDHPVEVQLQGIVTAQLIMGSFKNVSMSVQDAPLQNGMRADLSATADSMPRDLTKGQIDNGVVGVTFNKDQLDAVTKILSMGIGQDAQIESDQIKISNSFSIFGQQIPIVLSLVPGVKNGSLHVTPVSIEAGSMINITLEQVAEIPALSDLADGFEICVADKIPAGITLEEINLSSAQTLSVVASLDPQIGSEESLQQSGNC